MGLPVGTPKPPGGNPLVVFEKPVGVRVIEATRYVEGMRKNQIPDRRNWGNPGGAILKKAITGTGGIAAGSSGGLVPGSATVTIATWNGTTLAAGTQTVTAYNFTTSAVGASKPVTIGWLSIGLWEVILEPC